MTFNARLVRAKTSLTLWTKRPVRVGRSFVRSWRQQERERAQDRAEERRERLMGY